MTRQENASAARSSRGAKKNIVDRQYNAFEAIGEFEKALAAAGLAPESIVADGQLHRCRTDGDKNGKKSGAYVLHLDGAVPAGYFQNWRTGQKEIWCARSRDAMTPQEQASIRRMIGTAKRQRQIEQEATYRSTAAKAARLWSQCEHAMFHGYLRRKAILPFGARIDRHDSLVIPATDGEKITTLQFIAPDGTKRFLRGGKKRGSYFVIGADPSADTILICEGFATGATLHMQTRRPVVAAFDANNLLPVAQKIRAANPEATIIVAADDDRWTPGNPGVTKARSAAMAIGARLLVPDFSGLDLSSRPTDFNDLFRLQAAKTKVQGVAA